MGNPPPIARELVEVLQQDDMTRQLIRQHDFEFTLSNSLQLVIKNVSPPVAETADSDTAETSAK
jgi:hypothetical protein